MSIDKSPGRVKIDARGLRCPMPIVELGKAARTCVPGDEIEVVADDPAFAMDVEAWCRRTRSELLERRHEGDDIVARLRLGPPSDGTAGATGGRS